MFRSVALDDKYLLNEGPVYVTGTQTLVRLPMLQLERDRAAGLKVGAFISGYRGSPLGGYDEQLWLARKLLEENDINFNPGVNEDLAATSIMGSQQVGLFPGATHDGVLGIWYGKGPGVDRSVDALRHANYAGTSRNGGVLMLVGDDHAAVSSSIAHQSEFSLQSAGIPILHASSIREYLDFGLLGIAMSRYSGLWVGFKCLTETVESSGTIALGQAQDIRIPDFSMPPDGVHIRLQDPYLAAERRLLEVKLPAARAFARANRIDKVVFGASRPRLGVITVGKTYGDVREALRLLGMDEARCLASGIGVYKVGMAWPLEPEGVLEFAEGAEEIFVIEEKRALIEPQVKDALYHLTADRRPRVIGKSDQTGAPLIYGGGELSPEEIRLAMSKRLAAMGIAFTPINEEYPAPSEKRAQPAIARIPYFCSGCPHNSSTKVPEGSRAAGGIGCHSIALAVPDRNTATLTQMGGEGAPWIGQANFTSTKHIFQNLGDGTYFHSGQLAIRAAAAAGVNITFKILFNDAVAMTGGQPVDGTLTVPGIVMQMAGEGVAKTVIVADDPDKYGPGAFAMPVEIFHRDELDWVQRMLREIPGCTVLIYDQVCAAEKRRRRKRGTFPVSNKRAFINEAVCEGCGDCSVASNCVSVEPLETALGRKRTINQHTCNNDLTCINGFCPSFVTITGGKLRKAGGSAARPPQTGELPPAPAPSLDKSWDILVTGVGGTGVITIGAILGMAAHVDGLNVSVLDNTGLSQKNGAVSSHVRIARSAEELHTVRIPAGETDLLLACDAVVAVSPDVRSRFRRGSTHAVVNSCVTPTAEFQWNRAAETSSELLQERIRDACGHNLTDVVEATRLATALTGDAIGANMFLLGYALQRGLLPVSAAAIERAIELNGAAVDANKAALAWGRMAAHDQERVKRAAGQELDGQKAAPKTLDEIVEHRAALLTAYQDENYAASYRELVARAREAESRHTPDMRGFAQAVAIGGAKLMAYKDEYEVARLYTDPQFRKNLDRQFEQAPRLTFHLAPPIFSRRDPQTGHQRKRAFGPWMMQVFRVLARLKFLRGTAFDPFGLTQERKTERQLVKDYFECIDMVCKTLNRDNHAHAVQLAELPNEIVGFGHVKERNIKSAMEKRERLLESFGLKPNLVSAA